METEILRDVGRTELIRHNDAAGETVTFRILHLSCGHWALQVRQRARRPKRWRCITCEHRAAWDREDIGPVAQVTDFPPDAPFPSSGRTPEGTARPGRIVT